MPVAQEMASFVKFRDDHVNRRKAHRRQIRDDVCSAYEFGLRLMHDQTLWSAFLEEDWGDIKPPDPSQQAKAVRFAIKFMVGGGKAAQQKASFYYVAVKAFEKVRAVPDVVRTALEMKGFKKLAAENASSRKKKYTSAELVDSSVSRKLIGKASNGGKGSVQASHSSETRSDRTEVNKPTTKLSREGAEWDCALHLSGSALELLRFPVGAKFSLSGSLETINPLILKVNEVCREDRAGGLRRAK